MKPDDINNNQAAKTREAAANIIRSQIDTLYVDHSAPKTQPKAVITDENVNPYQKTHTNHPTPQAEQWRKYHTAWQDYYQKYYEGYYNHHLKLAKEQMANSQSQPVTDEKISEQEALSDLRQKLITRVKDSAKKVKKSRHFIPIASGLIVVLLILFVQFNRVLVSNVAAYVSPGSIDPQNIIIDPSTDVVVGPASRLIIPKINVDVPVIYDIGNDYDSQMAAMQKGVAHFAIPGASSHPGQIGNTVIAGHSSNDLFDGGDYKFIFAQLDKLGVGDTIYINYQSKRYTYTVTKKDVVKPNDVQSLVYATTKPMLTLLTCTPLGTSLNRLLVTAEQISPDPNQSAAAPSTNDSKASTSIPGSSPTFFERLFSGNWK